MLDAKKIRGLIGNKAETVMFDVIDSTNTEAKRRASALAAKTDLTPVLILAREQTAGRGRVGREFLSRADSGIYMSLMYFTDRALEDAVSVTTAAAAIVAEELERAVGRPMRIKWVNDIYNEGGKVSGILVETLNLSPSCRAIIVGIGINTGEREFPEELRGIASSVGDLDGNEETLIARIAERLLSHAYAPEDRAYMTEYRKRFMLMGEKVNLLVCGEVTNEGRVMGVDDDGGLLFLPDGKSEILTVRSGEISVRIKE